MSWKKVTDTQWEKIAEQLPIRKKSPQGGRPPADDRKCFEGISGQVLPGVNYRVDMVQKVRSIGDCKNGQKRKTSEHLWKVFFSQLQEKEQIRWNECFIDGTFRSAKKGRKSRKKTKRGQENKAYGTG